MSALSSPVTSELFAYVSAHTTQEDEFLTELKAAARAAGLPEIWICPEQASFMQILLKLSKVREVIEIGTLAGYSAIVMARALPAGGRVRTIELEPKHADFAEEWIARSDVAGQVEVHRGAGVEVLPGFAADSVDAVFIDADKSNYRTYLEQSRRIVRHGGLIMADNAFAFGHLLDGNEQGEGVTAVRRFNDLMARQTGLHGIIVPYGDGCWVAVKE